MSSSDPSSSSRPSSFVSSADGRQARNQKNPSFGSSGGRAKTTKTLPSLLRYMEGYEIIVELKTGRRIQGTLSSADDYMNLTLDDVHPEKTRNATTPTNNEKADDEKIEVVVDDNNNNNNLIASSSSILSSLNIRGPQIRYIHFPDNADLAGLVRSGVERERNAINQYKRTKRK